MREPPVDHDLGRLIEIFVVEMKPADAIEQRRIEDHALRLVRASIMLTSIKGPEQALRDLDERQ